MGCGCSSASGEHAISHEKPQEENSIPENTQEDNSILENTQDVCRKWTEKAEDLSALAGVGIAVAEGVLRVGESLPFGIGGVCKVGRDILRSVENAKNVADDVLEVVHRINDTLCVLSAAAQKVETVPHPEEITDRIDDLMLPLKDLKELVDQLGKKGWLEKMWKMRRYGQSLLRLDRFIQDRLQTVMQLITLISSEDPVQQLKDEFQRAMQDAQAERAAIANPEARQAAEAWMLGKLANYAQPYQYVVEVAMNEALQQVVPGAIVVEMTPEELKQSWKEVSAMVGQVDDQIASAVDKLQIDEAANMEVGRKAGITEKVLREEFSRLSQQIADGFENVAGRLDGVEQEMRKLTARQDSQHDNDYWLQVAMEPPQVITGNRAAYHDFQTRMDQLEKALKDTDVATKLRHERSFPICLSDTTQTKMTTEITKGSMKSLLWVSHGSNCLTSSRELTVEKLRHELKRTEKLPELIVLAMKHGASAAAAELKGLTNVIWLSADTTSKNIIKTIVKVLIPAVQNFLNGVPLEAATRTIKEEAPKWMKSSEDHAVGSSNATNTPVRPWNPHFDHKEIIVKKFDCAKSTVDSKKAKVQDLLSCDINQAEELHELLHKKNRGVQLVRIAGPDIERCRTLAMHQCEAFVGSPDMYDEIHRINSEADLQGFSDPDHCCSMLLWLDIQAEMPSLDTLIDSFEEGDDVCVLLTCPESAQSTVISSTHQFTSFDIVSYSAAAQKTKACQLHDEITLRISMNQLSPSELADVLSRTMKRVSNVSCLAAVYQGNSAEIVVMRLCVRDVEFLNQLRDEALMGGFCAKLTAELDAQDGNRTLKRASSDLLAESFQTGKVEVTIDLTTLALFYEGGLLRMHQPTAHQLERVGITNESLFAAPDGRVHIPAPAGTGKSFMGMYCTRKQLRDNGSVMLIANTSALIFTFVKWLWHRMKDGFDDPDKDFSDDYLDDPVTRFQSIVARLHVRFDPITAGSQGIHIDVENGKIETRPVTSLERYDLVVVDEAHHVLLNPANRQVVNDLSKGTRLLLLSDVSQSLGMAVEYPKDMIEVPLTEVVRSTKRIISAASSFQIRTSESSAPICQHQSQGPPLQTFLFDLNDTNLYDMYAGKTVQALHYVTDTFPGLSLHDRLAIITPDDTFCAGLHKSLTASLQMDAKLRDRFRLITADKASATCTFIDGQQRPHKEWLLLETARNMDGLERLIVICVGLDAPMQGSESDILGNRSLLYRGITRAYMQVLVVNEFYPDGWLAHLANVKLVPNVEFDAEKALAETQAAAQQVEAERMKRSQRVKEVPTAMQEALGNSGLELDEHHTVHLIELVTEKVQYGQAVANAVNAVIAEFQIQRVLEEMDAAAMSLIAKQWLFRTAAILIGQGKSSEEAVKASLELWQRVSDEIRQTSQDFFTPPEGEPELLISDIATQVLNGKAMPEATTAHLRSHRLKECVRKEATKLQLTGSAALTLQTLAETAMQNGEEVNVAVQTASREWEMLTAAIAAEVEAQQLDLGKSLDELQVKVTRRWKNELKAEGVVSIVKQELQQWQRRVQDHKAEQQVWDTAGITTEKQCASLFDPFNELCVKTQEEATNQEEANNQEEALATLRQLGANPCTETEIKLEACDDLTELPQVISECKALKTLTLLTCKKLTSLEGISGCVALKELRCNDCNELTSLGGIGGCTALQTLNLVGCASLASLGDGIGGCTALQVLILEECASLTSLGDAIGGCTSLQKLVLSNCSKLKFLPAGIGGCTALNSFYLSRCSSLESLGDGIGGCVALKVLDCQGCKKLTSLGGIGGCTALKTLYLMRCSSLTSFGNGIGGCTALQELFLYDCSSLTSLGDDISGCTALQTLNLRGCSSLRSLGDDLRQQLVRQGCEILE